MVSPRRSRLYLRGDSPTRFITLTKRVERQWRKGKKGFTCVDERFYLALIKITRPSSNMVRWVNPLQPTSPSPSTMSSVVTTRIPTLTVHSNSAGTDEGLLFRLSYLFIDVRPLPERQTLCSQFCFPLFVSLSLSYLFPTPSTLPSAPVFPLFSFLLTLSGRIESSIYRLD